MRKKTNKEETVTSTVRFPESLMNRIDELAAKKKWSRNLYIENVLKKHINFKEDEGKGGK